MFVLRPVIATDRSLLEANPALWRKVRRFNDQGQLAVAVALEAARGAANAPTMGLVGLAGCQSGSSQMFSMIESFLRTSSDPNAYKFNPTYTLHALDNLTLSVVSIELRNRAYAICLGGAAGQCWDALDIASTRLQRREEAEFLIFGGDQSMPGQGPIAAAAVLLSATPPPEGPVPAIRVDAVEWTTPAGAGRPAKRHAADGLVSFLKDLSGRPRGPFEYVVPPEHGNGLDLIRVHGALT